MGRDISEMIVKNIKSRLKSLEKRPQWLSEKTGISPGAISAFLNGVQGKDPRITTLIKIAMALGVSIDELCQEGPPAQKESTAELHAEIGEQSMKIKKLEKQWNEFEYIATAIESADPEVKLSVLNILGLAGDHEPIPNQLPAMTPSKKQVADQPKPHLPRKKTRG